MTTMLILWSQKITSCDYIEISPQGYDQDILRYYLDGEEPISSPEIESGYRKLYVGSEQYDGRYVWNGKHVEVISR